MKKHIKKIAGLICVLGLSFAASEANAQSAYFGYTGSLQTWTVPSCVDQITVTATGGQGGLNGGMGASITGTFNVTQGDVINIIAAGTGFSSSDSYSSGGGGGSFVWDNATTTLFIAAAGGGGNIPPCGGNGGAGSATLTTTSGGGGNGSAAGGSGGNGGSGGTGNGSGGGCGWLSNGSNGANTPTSYGGSDPANGAAGGAPGGYYSGGYGGYGGGGGSWESGCGSSGGGGGYNGGGGGNNDDGAGGGGGSYNGGSNQNNITGANSGDGYVTISWSAGYIPVTDTGSVVRGITCNGTNNGIACAIVTGGSAATYTYSWAPGGQTTDTINGLSPGTYTVSVNNSCGGSATSTVTITQPNILTQTGNVINSVSCSGANDGKVSALVTGGTMPYTYSWNNGNTNDTLSGLSAGIYKVVLMDNNGCSNSTTVTVTQPNILTLATNITSNASCGTSNGSIASLVTGGTVPYAYSWTGGATTASISALSGGTYVLNVMDNNGCMATSSVIITETPAVFVSATTLKNLACNGDNDGAALSRVSDGAAPFTYLWSNGETNFSAAGLTAGSYSVTVTDINGCSSSAQVSVTQPTAINVVVDTTVDIGGCTGAAAVLVSGGVSPYNYVWSTGGTTFQITGECKGTYCCNITDANGCLKQVCVTIKSITGIDNIQSTSGQIIVYPNPNNGQFTISSPGDNGKSIVEIYNVLGEKVYSMNLGSTKGTNTVNMGNEPNGIYLYRIITETGNLIGDGKIVLQK